MSVRSILSFLTASSCLALAIGVTACGATVTSGVEDGAGASTASSSTGTTTDPGCDDCDAPPAKPQAIAVTAAQLGYNTCDNGTATSTGTGGTGGGCGGVDPTTVYLELGTPSPTCGSPQPSVQCGGTFTVSIGIPAARLVVGDIQLGDASLIATFSESGVSDLGGSECPFGGGSFTNGTLTITAVDDTSVAFSLTGTQGFDFAGGTADGSYVAPRCN